MAKTEYLTARLTPTDAKLARRLADQVTRGNQSAAIRHAIREAAAARGLDRPTEHGGKNVPEN